MKWIKKWSVNIGLVIVGTIFLLLLCEIILRALEKEKKLSWDYRYYVHDTLKGYDLAKNFPQIDFFVDNYKYKVWTNELGCFDKPYKSGEKDFILLVGDSFTWGVGDYEYIYGTFLEKQINLRVLKCGVSGFGTKQEYLKSKDVLRQVKNKPRLIIVGYFMGNDFQDDYLFPRCTVIKGYLIEKQGIVDPVAGKKIRNTNKKLEKDWEKNFSLDIRNIKDIGIFQTWLANRFAIYRFFKTIPFLRNIRFEIKLRTSPPRLDVLAYLPPSKHIFWLEEAWKVHLNNIKKIKEFSDSLETQLLFVIIPTKEQVYKFLRPEYMDASYKNKALEVFAPFIKDINWFYGNNRLKNFFAKNNIKYLDLSPIFINYAKYANHKGREFLDSEKDLYRRYDTHWTVYGHRLAGLAISKYVLKNNLGPLLRTRKKKLIEIEKELSKLKKIMSEN